MAKKRGGAQPGAGRPKTNGLPTNILIEVNLKKRAKELKINLSKFMNEALKKYFEELILLSDESKLEKTTDHIP